MNKIWNKALEDGRRFGMDYGEAGEHADLYIRNHPEELPAHAWLGYPGMGSLEEVEIHNMAEDAGYIYVRPLGSDDEIKVHALRLFDSPRGSYDGPDEHTVRV